MHHELPGGKRWLSCAKVDRGYLLRFHGLADFFIRGDGQEIVCCPRPELPPHTTRHLLLDQVIPLVMNLKGREALHASAVLTPEGVVAFVGLTGSGKSTLAGSFVRVGYSLFSDDCLALVERHQGINAIPAYPGLRLRRDALAWLFGNDGAHTSVAHYTDKHRVAIGTAPVGYCAEPGPLVRLYALTDPAEAKGKTGIAIDRLSPRDKLMALIRSAFRLDITDPAMLTRQLCFLARVVSIVPVRRLLFPRDFRRLPAVREAILADLKEAQNGQQSAMRTEG